MVQPSAFLDGQLMVLKAAASSVPSAAIVRPLLTVKELSAAVQVPLFIAILLGVAVGLVIGLIWEWIRESKHRTAATRIRREAQRLEDEVKRLKAEKHEGKDEVLALLEQTS